ncbi:nuclear transport factor 2 [Leptolyngbya sp. Heron Island J]|uniref:nuclear transport factor 2 family protein n=1 Tax=Leptolyngbya sp. Heron Island J TaxID=1385935 RepID=UPI0003B9E30B|nr:ketosteroid isomerase family protein [Leptolyngbya sp. Heron Island J]ESA32982.1 nuclear transport factor 2 [Leptolyngbya sp. Heron Island J]
MTVSQTIERPLAAIAQLGKSAEVVLRYFTLFNSGEYQQVADLFAIDGSLYPPFEAPVVGRDNIADYLIKEADGMTVSLLDAEVLSGECNCLQVNVRGSVTALVFKVKVVWCFVLTDDNKIESVRVDLVATLEELLRIRPQ